MFFKSAFKSSWIGHVLFSLLFMGVVFGIYRLGWSFVTPVTTTERCTEDFGPREKPPVGSGTYNFHKGVDISNTTECDDIRNIYQELVTINAVVNSVTAGHYAKTFKTGGLYVRYLHMANSCPNSTDPNRWQFKANETLDGGTVANIIVKYSNGSVNKVWGSVTGETYLGVAVTTTLASAEVFGRVDSTGQVTGPHLHIDMNNVDNFMDDAKTHPPFKYIPRTADTTTPPLTSLTLTSPTGSIPVNQETKFTYALDSLSDAGKTKDLDFEKAILEFKLQTDSIWSSADSGFAVIDLVRTTGTNPIFKMNNKDRMKTIGLGDDEIYLYWTPTATGYYDVRCTVYHANGSLMMQVTNTIQVQ